MNRSSLRQQLVLPFVFLVVFVSACIGWISFRAGEMAVADLTQRVLLDSVGRIADTTERHLAGAFIALQAVAPSAETVPRIQPFSDDLGSMEERFWIASGLFMEVNNYVYFGGTDGRFIGVNRVDPNRVMLFLREPSSKQRSVYASMAPGDRKELLRTDDFDPRTRPWYQSAINSSKPVWSPVYNDFANNEPTITLARPVYRADRSLAGVMATDMVLKTFSEYLRKLSVGHNGVAFLVDEKGVLIATSDNKPPMKIVDGRPVRMHPGESGSDLVRNAYAKVRAWKEEGKDLRQPVAGQLTGTEGAIELAVAQFGERYGIHWTAVVAIPRADFMSGVTRSLYQSALIAAACVLIAVVLGVFVLNRVLRDIRLLTSAARQVGNGEPLPLLNIRRRDEIGQLAKTFSEMEHNLRIDKLTSVFNRESLNAQIDFLQRQAMQHPLQRINFALVFIDLDHFKSINDHYGHGAGDQALIAVAARLKAAVRNNDVVARYGGDEFVVLLKGIVDRDDIVQASDKIRAAVEEPITLDHGDVHVGVSLGWAIFPQDGRDTKTLLKVADSRMFHTKKIRKAAR